VTDKYILAEDGKTPVAEEDVLKWGRWFESAKRHVAEDYVRHMRVSTIFLGLDYSFGDGPPLLWQTMVFGGPLDQAQQRYSSYEDAVEGHAEMLCRVKGA
jgi:hypothetical protein